MAEGIRGLTRGLDVLEILDTGSGFSLAELHARTGLSKPSLLRVLNTLDERGYARRRLADNAWRRTSRYLGKAKEPLHDLLVDVADDVLDSLRSRVVWPSDLAVFHHGMMELLDTTARRVPIMVDRVFVGHRVHVMPTGIGRCYLAFCSAHRRERILAQLAHSDDPFDRPARDGAAVEVLLAGIRKKGYALRVKGYSNLVSSMLGQMSGAGIPVFIDDCVVACLSLVWFSKSMDEATFEKKQLGLLQDAAAQISRKLSAELSSRNLVLSSFLEH
jgi:IclR family mhp operon transcriptional activator